MKMIDPTAMSRFTALREAAGKIDHLVPHVRLMEQPPHESRNTTSVALEFPTPLVVLNSTHPAGAVLPVLCLRHRADGQDGARYPLHLHRFPDVGHGGLGINRPSDFEKLSSDKRLAWRALSTLGAQLPLMDPSLSVEEVPANNWHAHRHGHGLHSKRPHACQWAHGCARCFLIMQVSCAPIVRGWLHLHGIHFKSHMDGGRPFVSAPPLSVLHGMLMPNATHTRNQLCSKKHGPG